MLLYVTDGLKPAETQELRAHLASGCPRCAGALAEAQATVAHLPDALPKVTPPASARDKLLSRVAAGGSTQSPRRSTWSRLAVAACIGALLSGLIVWSNMRGRTVDRFPTNVQYVALKGGDPQPKASGRIFWDRDANKWHLQVFDLAPPPPGRTYELWFITPNQTKIPGPTFNVDQNGRANLVAAVPSNVGTISIAAITDEPAGGVAVPTGSVQLVGETK